MSRLIRGSAKIRKVGRQDADNGANESRPPYLNGQLEVKADPCPPAPCGHSQADLGLELTTTPTDRSPLMYWSGLASLTACRRPPIVVTPCRHITNFCHVAEKMNKTLGRNTQPASCGPPPMKK